MNVVDLVLLHTLAIGVALVMIVCAGTLVIYINNNRKLTSNANSVTTAEELSLPDPRSVCGDVIPELPGRTQVMKAFWKSSAWSIQ